MHLDGFSLQQAFLLELGFWQVRAAVNVRVDLRLGQGRDQHVGIGIVGVRFGLVLGNPPCLAHGNFAYHNEDTATVLHRSGLVERMLGMKTKVRARVGIRVELGVNVRVGC